MRGGARAAGSGEPGGMAQRGRLFTRFTDKDAEEFDRVSGAFAEAFRLLVELASTFSGSVDGQAVDTWDQFLTHTVRILGDAGLDANEIGLRVNRVGWNETDVAGDGKLFIMTVLLPTAPLSPTGSNDQLRREAILAGFVRCAASDQPLSTLNIGATADRDVVQDVNGFGAGRIVKKYYRKVAVLAFKHQLVNTIRDPIHGGLDRKRDGVSIQLVCPVSCNNEEEEEQYKDTFGAQHDSLGFIVGTGGIRAPEHVLIADILAAFTSPDHAAKWFGEGQAASQRIVHERRGRAFMPQLWNTAANTLDKQRRSNAQSVRRINFHLDIAHELPADTPNSHWRKRAQTIALECVNLAAPNIFMMPGNRTARRPGGRESVRAESPSISLSDLLQLSDGEDDSSDDEERAREAGGCSVRERIVKAVDWAMNPP